jgi:hypothetical protein
MQTKDRVRLGLPNMSQEFTAIRERWATITNEALKEANIEARVDHRSLAEQGIDREPKPHIPFAAYKIERAGKYSEVAENIRAGYNARVQARLEQAWQQPTSERSTEHGVASAVTAAQPTAYRADSASTATQTHADTTSTPQTARHAAAPQAIPQAVPQAAPKTLEDIRREARENWLKMRAEQTAKSPDQLSADVAAGARAADTRHQPHAAAGMASGQSHTATGAHAAGADARVPTTPSHSNNTPAHDDDHHP